MREALFNSVLNDLVLHHFDYDDFLSEDTTRWSTTASDLGASVCLDAAGGLMELQPSDGTVGADDETYIYTANEIILCANNKPLMLEGLMKVTEANTDDASVIFGLMDAPGADALVDAGAGPKTSYTGACFFKVKDSLVWKVQSSMTTTQLTTTLDATGSLTKTAISVSTGTMIRLRIEWQPRNSSSGDWIFYADGICVAKHTDRSYTGTEMKIVAGVKNGSTNHDKLTLDYVAYCQTR
jgi:hypothetical protein